MAGPISVNPTATAINQGISDVVQAIEKVAIASEIAALEAASPIFALPVIKEVMDEGLTLGTEWIGGKLSVGLQQVGTFIVIDTQVATEKKGISAALAALMIAEKSGDQKAIQAALAAYGKAQSALINDDGSATPHA